MLRRKRGAWEGRGKATPKKGEDKENHGVVGRTRQLFFNRDNNSIAFQHVTYWHCQGVPQLLVYVVSGCRVISGETHLKERCTSSCCGRAKQLAAFIELLILAFLSMNTSIVLVKCIKPEKTFHCLGFCTKYFCEHCYPAALTIIIGLNRRSSFFSRYNNVFQNFCSLLFFLCTGSKSRERCTIN